MICRLCLKDRKLADSHIIPEFIYKSMYDKNHRFLEMPDVDVGKVGYQQKGYREQLLCFGRDGCENRLNHYYEQYARKLFVDSLPPPESPNSKRLVFKSLKYGRFKLFILSVLWRASISSHPMFERINLGDVHEEKIRLLLLASDPGAPSAYPCAIVAIMNNGQHFKGLIPTPLCSRVEGHKFYGLVLDGFLFMVFVSGHGLPSMFEKMSLTNDGLLSLYPMEWRHMPFLCEIGNRVRNSTQHLPDSFGIK